MRFSTASPQRPAGSLSSITANPIGLKDPISGGAISLEPGGQFELSGAPVDTLHSTAEETAEHMRVAKTVGAELGIHFLGLGVTPLWSVAEIPPMPKAATAS